MDSVDTNSRKMFLRTIPRNQKKNPKSIGENLLGSRHLENTACRETRNAATRHLARKQSGVCTRRATRRNLRAIALLLSPSAATADATASTAVYRAGSQQN